MSEEAKTKKDWKEKARHELFEYWTTALYLFLYFGAFIEYRRLLLAEYHIHYTHYGFALIQSLILAKVILIGDWLGVGRLRKGRPLIVSTLFRTARFCIWVALFTIVEHLLDGLLRGEGVRGGLDELYKGGKYELLGRILVVFFTFIPFFAFRELNELIGEGKMWRLFFKHYEPSSGHLTRKEA